MATPITLESLAACTVTYNGVQFGGSDSSYTMTPPIFTIQGHFEWDGSHRSIKGTKYILGVQTVVNSSSQANQSILMSALRVALSAPGKTLTIVGLGTGFDLLIRPQNDIFYGPKPIGLPQFNIIGQIACELTWQVEFFVKECPGSVSPSPLAFAAFNFDTTWQNNFEGLCSRTISGYVEIIMQRTLVAGFPTGNRPQHVVDEVRDYIGIYVPAGYKRITNVWRENDAKDRLDFVVTDEALPGDAYPPGIIQADGEETFETSDPAGGFANSSVSMSMNFRVAPGVPAWEGGRLFITAAISKHLQMQRALDADKKLGTVIATGIRISNGKFDRARNTSASMSWVITKCLNAAISAAGIWNPIPYNGDTPIDPSKSYQQWFTSVNNLWVNRGVPIAGNQSGSAASEAVIIDLCSNTRQIAIGSNREGQSQSQSQKPSALFGCPVIDKDGGWMGYDLKLRILRMDEQIHHKKAITYAPTQGRIGSTGDQGVMVQGPSWIQNAGEEADVEYNGKPITYVLLQFKGLRLQHKPVIPTLISVGGVKAIYEAGNQDTGPGMDILTCPTWYTRSWAVYRINGPVLIVQPAGSATSCGAPFIEGQTVASVTI